MAKARNPYVGRPDYQFWRREAAIVSPDQFDPVETTSFKITRDEAVVTAGSCFAQHVARRLATSGYNFLVTERAHPLVPLEISDRFNYGAFSARYGNIYNARQLRQLIDRAWGRFEPEEIAWKIGDGRFVDPFRPQIEPGGFVSRAELKRDRVLHLAAVRRALAQMKVFVFTLGLTEAWVDRRDGSVFPLAPGVAGGSYDPALHHFVNFGVDETVADLSASIAMLRAVNPGLRIILTVSPVPLNATATDRHVLVATTWSKAVLRIAAQTVADTHDHCDYFPSFEIITSPYARGSYYGSDCREIVDRGVDHVMGCFFRHYGDGGIQVTAVAAADDRGATQARLAAIERTVDILCDEEAIDNAP